MKRPIKLIAAVVAFVFTLEQVAYPAPYPGQRRRNPSALRAVASKAGVPAGAPVEFFKGTDSLRTPEAADRSSA